MILTKQVENEAILSNVGATTDFKIKATAKSFRILADGLYANKIRAIVRELSCNAYDSHVAAGKVETPFDVHLPNSLEPWFSIRDYGVGLNNDEVTNIFTTFFESTKTGSNDFVGALGLGSKSPFSYTDNFTVTAIKNGIKSVYTAFINEQGVPSIALMAQEETTDPNGVEIRFAVESRYDFDSFCSEAEYVYRTFKYRPVVSGNSRFKFTEFEYETKDIIPGVHVLNKEHSRSSVAIMGNIGYPIRVPDSDNTLGDLKHLLHCGLVLEFEIGELDFQASREGLSYIPQTINAIKKKLEALNAEIYAHVEREAAAIENSWVLAAYLIKKSKIELWNTAVNRYVKANNINTVSTDGNWIRESIVEFELEKIRTDYNIDIRGFIHSEGEKACTTIANSRRFDKSISDYIDVYRVGVSTNNHFVVTDTKVGAAERAKYHWRKNNRNRSACVHVLSPANKEQPMKLVEFFDALYGPPESNIHLASKLDMKPRKAGMGKNVSIMCLERRNSGSRYARDEMVWRSAGNLNMFSTTKTFYYLPIKGFESMGKVADVKGLHHNLVNGKIFLDTIFGVRKADIEEVEALSNWVNLDDYLSEKLKEIGDEQVMGLVKSGIDFHSLYKYDTTLVDSNSPFLKLYNEFKDVKKVDSNVYTSIKWLCAEYGIQTNGNIDVAATIDKYKQEVRELNNLYPLLKYLSYVPEEEVARYINMIDNFNNNQKGE